MAKGLISERLAACVTIIPGAVSIFRWEGKIHTEEEQLMIIKSHSCRWEAMTKYLNKYHPYEMCEIVNVPIISGSVPYLNWVMEGVRNSTDSPSE